MPRVKLKGGWEVALRTMFYEQKCQMRYNRIGACASYPLTRLLRIDMAAALEWLADEENEGKTWINTDKKEVLFAYPYEQYRENMSFVKAFKSSGNEKQVFIEQAEMFVNELQKTKDPDTDSYSDGIQVFILRSLDKGRSKIVYTRQTDANELEKCSEEWNMGCAENLPEFAFGKPETPFPLDAVDIFNCFWKQNGKSVTEKYKPMPKYHGMELLLEPNMPVDVDMRLLSNQAMTLGEYLGHLRAEKKYRDKIWENVRKLLAMLGLLLYREKIGKEDYMENMPYLYGQLLKACDELHALYCKVERKGEIPPRLVGGATFQAAAEAPVRTLAVLGQRMMPYYTWAKSYRLRNDSENAKERVREAGWLIDVCERIMTMLREKMADVRGFNDAEKAQLFIGYLAEFQKKEKTEDGETKEEQIDE